MSKTLQGLMEYNCENTLTFTDTVIGFPCRIPNAS